MKEIQDEGFFQEVSRDQLNKWIVEWIPEEEIITEDAEFEVIEPKLIEGDKK